MIPLCRFLKPKLAPLFISPTINSPTSLLVNVYQNFIHAALKMHAYLRELKRDGLADIRGAVLVEAIDEAIKFANRMVLRHTSDINVSCLGYRAFFKVLDGRPGLYRGYVLEHLESRINKYETEDDRRLYGSLLDDASNELIMNIL